MSLLIPSHALPPFSYLVPERLTGEVRVGTAVVAPLSGYSRLGIVVGFEEEAQVRPLKEIRSVVEGLSLPESLVRLCIWTAGAAAFPLHAVLRLALPPGLDASCYEVRRPASNWPWKAGTTVSRAALRRALGGEALKAAESAGRIVFTPVPPTRRTVEWAVCEAEYELQSLRRAPRQRALLEVLAQYGGARPVAELLRAAGAGRDALRRLVRRGGVRLEKRPEPVPVSYTRGSGAGLAAYGRVVERAFSRGGDWVWRMPDAPEAAAAVARAAIKGGKQAVVLAPETKDVERLVEAFEEMLPAGLTVAPYHGGIGRRRAAVYEAVRRGEVDVLVGTRAAMFVPVERLGAICVMDEPNEAHRGPAGGYEGVPIHVRDLARARGRIEDDAPVFFFSPFPSLRLYAPESGVSHLPPVEPGRWPAVAVVDMRGTGTALSSTLIESCHRAIRLGRHTGVVVNRLGHAASVSCNRCGFIWRCPACDRPLGVHGDSAARFLFCGRCGYRESAVRTCPACGSERLGGAGFAVERVRVELSKALGVEVGLLTASEREGEGAPVVVGTAHCVLEGEWDLVVVPDADSLLFAGSAEKGFRLLYRAAAASRDRLLVQTRSPEHPVLQAALRGDYEAFTAMELPRRRALGYPPHGYLAEITFEGNEAAVRRAVESKLRPALGSRVEVIDPVPLMVSSSPGSDVRSLWRTLLKGRNRAAVAEAAARVARLVAAERDRKGLKAWINMDPEEV